MGPLWFNTYSGHLSFATDGNGVLQTVYVFRPDGTELIFAFNSSTGLWISKADTNDQLTELTDGSGNVTGWSLLVAATQATEKYDVNGMLQTITSLQGLVQTLTYSVASTPASIAPASGLLISVTDTFGRSLSFTYNAKVQLASVTDSNGSTISYAYDTNGQLSTVTYPGNVVRTYVYNESAYMGGGYSTQALTGIIDENGNRFLTTGYNSSARAVLSENGSSGANKIAITYGTNSATITDAINTSRNYAFQINLGSAQVTALNKPCNVCNDGTTAATGYDNNGNVASRIDFNNNYTCYLFDTTRNLEITRGEGLTTSCPSSLTSWTPAANTTQRKITTVWNSTYRLVESIAEPLRITTYVYNGENGVTCGYEADGATPVPGVPCSKTIQPTTDSNGASGFSAAARGSPRVWTYTYNSNGSVLTATDPRSNVTTYTYYPNTGTCTGSTPAGCHGQLATVTDALGRVTQITDYNANGQPLSITDPNGLVTTLAYDSRMRLTSKNVGGEITAYTYDGVGQLIQVTLPDSSSLTYTYDNAHRLTAITDNLGDKIAYTLDAMGNRTQDQVFDPSNTLTQTKSRVFNSLNRLYQEIGAVSGETTTYGYDNQGNVTSISDPLTHVTSKAYDALNRLISMTDPNSGVTHYGLNALDQLTSVQDPRNLITSYSIDGLNNLNQQTSPDTGTTNNTYDAAGNLLTKTDAKGQVATYTYDALNRVTGITYSTDPSLNVSFTYDQGTYGLGRLTGVTDNAGTIGYAYDIHGRLITETDVISGITYSTSYSYDSYGRLASVTYPSGRLVSYTRNTLGRINGITTTYNNTTQTLLTGVTYRPFGPELSFSFGNSQTYTRSFDQDGRVAGYTLPTQTLALGYDASSRISFIADTVNPANTNNYTYDSLDRLTGFTGPGINQGFIYDAVGNRTSQTIGANTYTAAYGATSNRIASVTGPTAKTYTLDANGSITSDSVNSYQYDARGRLNQSTTAAGVSQYLINTLGQRVKKTVAGSSTVFHYDLAGHLISETDALGHNQVEYVYLNDVPVAVLK